MSERPEAEIEDVLSSIRRLVAGDQGAHPSNLSVVSNPDVAPEPSLEDQEPEIPVDEAHTDLSPLEEPEPVANTEGAFLLTQESRLPTPDAPTEADGTAVPLVLAPSDAEEVAADDTPDAEFAAEPVAETADPEPEPVPETDTDDATVIPSLEAVDEAEVPEVTVLEEANPLPEPGMETAAAVTSQDDVSHEDVAPTVAAEESPPHEEDTFSCDSIVLKKREDQAEPSQPPEDRPLDMRSPAARAAMTARLGAMRAQWETDAAAESEKASKGLNRDQAPSEPPLSASKPEAEADAPRRRLQLSAESDASADLAEPEAKPPQDSERRPIWSRVQPAIEKVVRESLEPAVNKHVEDIDDMLLETAPETEPQLPSEATEPDQAAPEDASAKFIRPMAAEPRVRTTSPPVRARSREVEADSDADFPDNLFGPETGLESAEVRAVVVKIVHEELQGALGERITRNVRKLVRREIQRALASRDFD